MNKLSKNERASLIKKGKRRVHQVQTKEPAIENNEAFLLDLKRKYAKNIKDINNMSNELDYVKIALIEAEQIWINTQILMKTEDYKTMSDNDKVSLIQKDFAEFYKNFPIVARYMICLGQYRMKAFKKMLIKCKETKKTEKNESNETLWIERQADYVRFLWEEYQDSAFDMADSDSIWQQTYDALDAEFKEFRELHENAEKKIKSDALKHKKELLYELGERLVSGKQSLDNSTTISLLNKLKDKLFKQRYNKVIGALVQTIPALPAEYESVGTNIDEKLAYDDELKQSFYKKNYKKMDLNKIIQSE
jgi:hypothetical protein